MRRWHAASAPAARGGTFPVITTVAALALAGCAARAPMPVVVGPDPVLEAALVREAAIAFIVEEGRGDTAADTLLARDADFISDGVRVTTRPRLSGVLGPGLASVEDTRTEVAGPLAWVEAAYQWTSATSDDSSRGRATLILEREGPGWRIRHVHSSSVPPWS